MTISREITIWCDGCSNWEQLSGSQVTPIEKDLKKVGWTIVRSKTEGKQHFCRKCSLKIKEEKES